MSSRRRRGSWGQRLDRAHQKRTQGAPAAHHLVVRPQWPAHGRGAGAAGGGSWRARCRLTVPQTWLTVPQTFHTAPRQAPQTMPRTCPAPLVHSWCTPGAAWCDACTGLGQGLGAVQGGARDRRHARKTGSGTSRKPSRISTVTPLAGASPSDVGYEQSAGSGYGFPATLPPLSLFAAPLPTGARSPHRHHSGARIGLIPGCADERISMRRELPHARMPAGQSAAAV